MHIRINHHIFLATFLVTSSKVLGLPTWRYFPTTHQARLREHRLWHAVLDILQHPILIILLFTTCLMLGSHKQITVLERRIKLRAVKKKSAAVRGAEKKYPPLHRKGTKTLAVVKNRPWRASRGSSWFITPISWDI